MTFRHVILSLLSLTLSVLSYAAIIKGKIEHPNAPVKLLRYVNHITDSLVLVEEVTSDKDGTFRMNITADDMEKYKVTAGDLVATFFMSEPSTVSLTQRDTRLLVDDGVQGINSRLDSLFSKKTAWDKRNDTTLGRTPGEAVQELKQLKQSFLEKDESKWNRVVRHYIARSELFYTTVKRSKIDEADAVQAFNELEHIWLIENKIELDNPFYIEFLEHYIYSRHNLSRFRRLKGGMAPFSKLMGETSYFTKDSLKELAIVLGVKMLYGHQWYGKSNNISELDDSVQALVPKMKIPYFRQALVSISNISHRLKRGDSFPIIALNNTERKKTEISQVNSDYVLVGFWATWCSPCRESMTHYDSLQKQFGNRLSIVSISADKDFETMQSFLKNNNYTGKWLALHNGEKGKYLEALKIDGYPTYYLLDKDKKVVTSIKWNELHETLGAIIQ